MPTARYLHYDVFTARPFEGNQLAVFLDAGGLESAQMQTLTNEMNFAESTFVLPAESAGGGCLRSRRREDAAAGIRRPARCSAPSPQPRLP